MEAVIVDMPRLKEQIKLINFFTDNTIRTQDKSLLSGVYALLCNLEDTLKANDGMAVVRAKEEYDEKSKD